MPINLLEFVVSKTPGADSSFHQLITDLIITFAQWPPSYIDTEKSEFFYSSYKDQMAQNKHVISAIIGIILEMATFPISLQCPRPTDRARIWGGDITSEQQAMQSVFTLTVICFEYMYIGNCRDRSAYAASVLFQIFKAQNIKVKWISAPTIDQFVVYLGNKEEGWWIYDPLTNPELVFPHEEYKSKIIPLFKQVPIPAKKMELSITDTVMVYASSKRVAITSFINDALKTLTVANLRSNPSFNSSLEKTNQRLKIVANDEHIIAALTALKDKVS